MDITWLAHDIGHLVENSFVLALDFLNPGCKVL